MADLIIPSDAFSHGQIRSKLWLSENFAEWSKTYLKTTDTYTLNWYGSWVGLGPFMLLQNTPIKFKQINLYDLNAEHLAVSHNILNYWHCESIDIRTYAQDVNQIKPPPTANQIFVNTSCEHIKENSWLANIPTDSIVILQSTDMPHIEHINNPTDINDFISKYHDFINIKDSQQIDFQYPDKKFSRFMLFGFKK